MVPRPLPGVRHRNRICRYASKPILECTQGRRYNVLATRTCLTHLSTFCGSTERGRRWHPSARCRRSMCLNRNQIAWRKGRRCTGAHGNLQHALRQLLVAAPDLEDARVRGWQHGHHPCALTHAGASPLLQLQLPCSSIRQREAGRWGSHDWASAQAQCGAADSMWVQLFDSSPAAQRTCKCVECVVLVVVDPVHGCDELCSGCAQRWWLLRSILEVRQKQRRTPASLGGVD